MESEQPIGYRIRKTLFRMPVIQRFLFILQQFGFRPIEAIRTLQFLPRYIHDLFWYRRHYHGKLRILPCLNDWHGLAGAADHEYFIQDLYIAQKIFSAKPVKHVDIGSRIDGFVAHVASFREIEVVDIRPLKINVSGIVFLQRDIMVNHELIEYCDSVSCLHALEHFGLGRYGDPLDVEGSFKGLRSIAKMLKRGGAFYLSTPIGWERIEFNGCRILSPIKIVEYCGELGLVLHDFAWIDLTATLHMSQDYSNNFKLLSEENYNLGIFSFHKI